jgi:hypothetical protein
VRKTFENELFDVKAVHLNASSYMGVERRLRGWQSSQHLKQVLAELLLNPSQVLLGSNAFPDFATLVILAPGHLRLVSQVVRYRRSLTRGRTRKASGGGTSEANAASEAEAINRPTARALFISRHQ